MRVSHLALLVVASILIAVLPVVASPPENPVPKEDKELEELSREVQKRRAEVEDLEKALKKWRASFRTSSFVPKPERMPAPPPKVEGIVKEITPGGLVHISIGSDVGLQRGHILKVFRLDPKPEDSKFLGTIEVVSVRPREAVARRVRSTSDPLKPGDHVADRIR